MHNKFNDDCPEKQWALWRQDDNGHMFIISVNQTKSLAQQERESYERLGHKQYYWIEPYYC